MLPSFQLSVTISLIVSYMHFVDSEKWVNGLLQTQIVEHYSQDDRSHRNSWVSCQWSSYYQVLSLGKQYSKARECSRFSDHFPFEYCS